MYSFGFNQPKIDSTAGVYARLLLFVAICLSPTMQAMAQADSVAMDSPQPGSTLTGASQTFSWQGNGVDEWWLYVGTTRGGRDLHDSGALGDATSTTVSGLPLDSSTLHVRLFYREIEGRWRVLDSLYSAATDHETQLMPAAGTTLAAAEQTFTWSGNSVAEWWMYIGSAAGGRDIYNSGSLGAALSADVSGLPEDGSTVFVRLFYRVSGSAWASLDQQYTAYQGPEAIINSPAPASQVLATQAFSWSGTAVDEWWLYLGSSLGANDIHDSGSLGTATNTSVSGIPQDGRAVYARLYFRQAGSNWRKVDSEFVAKESTTIEILSPQPGTRLSGSDETISWQGPAGIDQWWLYVGSTEGGRDLYDSGLLTDTSAAVTDLPRDGSVVYTRLFYRGLGEAWKFADYTYTADTGTDGNYALLSDLRLRWGITLIADAVGSRLFMSLGDEYATSTNYRAPFKYELEESGYRVKIDGVTINSGDVLSRNLQHGGSFELELQQNGSTVEIFSVIVTNLPVFEISAREIVDEPKKSGFIRYVDGPRDFSSGWLRLGIEIRGSTSQLLPKKSYGVEIRDADGKEVDYPLLDLRDNDGDWIFDAVYRDQATVRNIVSMDIYRDMRSYAYIDSNGDERGKASVAGDVVELVLNGAYQGVYVVSEPMDRKLLDLDKVDVPEDESGDRWDLVDFTVPANGTLFIKADQNRTDFYRSAPIRDLWEQRYPDFRAPDYETVDRLDELQELIDFVGDSTNAEFVADISNRVDLSSVVDFYLLRMFTGNQDTFYKNYYIARNQSQKWFTVPWDFDATFGMNPDGSVNQSSTHFYYPAQNLMLCRLIRSPDSGFNAMVKARWDSLRGSLFTPQAVRDKFSFYLDRVGTDLSGTVENARYRNVERWPLTGHEGVGTSALGELDHIEQLITDRLVVLDRLFANAAVTGTAANDPAHCDPFIGEPAP